MACSGDDSTTCGGRNAISIYYGDSTPEPTPTPTPAPVSDWGEEDYTYLGCFADSVVDRVLSGSASLKEAELTIDVSKRELFCPYFWNHWHQVVLYLLHKPWLHIQSDASTMSHSLTAVGNRRS